MFTHKVGKVCSVKFYKLRSNQISLSEERKAQFILPFSPLSSVMKIIDYELSYFSIA
jgi:hypothetical protein